MIIFEALLTTFEVILRQPGQYQKLFRAQNQSYNNIYQSNITFSLKLQESEPPRKLIRTSQLQRSLGKYSNIMAVLAIAT